MPSLHRRVFLQTSACAALGVASRSAWAAATHPPGALRPPSKEFLATLPHLMELAQLPGLGIGVVEGGETTWQHYAGVANLTAKTTITAESLFPAASMGKEVFVYGVLVLAQQGKIDLDKPLKEYLSDGAPTGKWSEKITARHVLSHSSGLLNWRWEKDQELTPAFEPGTKFRYSGEGFYFLQRCLEHITGVGATAWTEEQVLKPLGMKSSTYLWRPDAGTRIVTGHRGDQPMDNTEFSRKLFAMMEAGGKPLSAWRHEEITAAMVKDKPPGTVLLPNDISPNVAFSLLTTVADYSAFLAQVVSPRNQALSPALWAAIRTPVSRINSALGWGLGFGIEQEGRQPRYLWQWGDNGGWKNFFLAHPESESAIVVFSNGDKGMHIVERVVKSASSAEQVAFLWL